jgi:hypothetical protein
MGCRDEEEGSGLNVFTEDAPLSSHFSQAATLRTPRRIISTLLMAPFPTLQTSSLAESSPSVLRYA